VNLAEQIKAKRAELQVLERRAAFATCIDLGHDWESTGGCNCGCERGYCSMPVNVCRRCGDCDYGYNDEAISIRQNCAVRRDT
jgi:hypothetical protein